MVNVVLIIIAVVMLGLLVVANFFIIVRYSSIEDKNTAWFPKIVTVNIIFLFLFFFKKYMEIFV